MRGRWICTAVLAATLLGVAAPAAAAKVTVLDTSGARPKPCPAIDAGDPAKPSGGCAIETAGVGDVEIVIRTVVGDMLFGDCSYDLDMRVDGTGRTYIPSPTVGGPSPCNDMNSCYHEDQRPWSGQIEAGAGGRLTHVVDACFDTCMGQFRGKLRLGLERVDGRWTQTADRALTGDSGYQLDGRWKLQPCTFDIRTAGPGEPSPGDASAGGDAAGAWLLTGEPVGWPI